MHEIHSRASCESSLSSSVDESLNLLRSFRYHHALKHVFKSIRARGPRRVARRVHVNSPIARFDMDA